MANELDIYNTLLGAITIIAVLVFVLLHKKTAPYGRHAAKRKGPLVGVKLGWMLMELPAVLIIAICFLIGDRKTETLPIIFLAMWEMHYIYRTFIFPSLIKESRAKWPIMILIYGSIFNVINGYLNGRYLYHFGPDYSVNWLIDPRFIIGVVVFLIGFSINLQSDSILRNLRKPGENGYKIPHGGMFKYVSCPNYLGEVIEWTGWAIATWSVPGLIFALFTFSNLGPRARSHHIWYLEKFQKYPKKRKAIIPFLY
jgi:hypothetical protein